MFELHQLIQKGKYEIVDDSISAEAKDLLSKLIQTNPKKRLSAMECLNHPWLQRTQDGSETINTNRLDLANVIFTENEKFNIKKDYLYRLEKIK